MHQFANLGSLAEYMVVHEHAVAKISEEIPFDRAALIGCGVTTGVGAVIHTAAVEAGSMIAVIGCGGVGLCCINGSTEQRWLELAGLLRLTESRRKWIWHENLELRIASTHLKQIPLLRFGN